MGAKARSKKSGQQLECLIDAVGARISGSADTAIEMGPVIRDNHKATLDERRTAQQIRESKQRLATDQQLLKLIDDKIIGANFVRIRDVREHLLSADGLGRLDAVLGDGTARAMVDRLFPEPKNRSYIDDVLAAYDKIKRG